MLAFFVSFLPFSVYICSAYLQCRVGQGYDLLRCTTNVIYNTLMPLKSPFKLYLDIFNCIFNSVFILLPSIKVYSPLLLLNCQRFNLHIMLLFKSWLKLHTCTVYLIKFLKHSWLILYINKYLNKCLQFLFSNYILYILSWH